MQSTVETAQTAAPGAVVIDAAVNAVGDVRTKILTLAGSKIGQLIGQNGRNMAFLEFILDIKITIRRKKDDYWSAEIPDEALVTLVATGREDFSDKGWSKNVYRYIKSATRGGFLKWLDQDERHSSSILQVEKDDLFERLQNRYAVKLECHWLRECDCTLFLIVEDDGCLAGQLEKAIEQAGQIIHNRFHRSKARVLAGIRTAGGAGAKAKSKLGH